MKRIRATLVGYCLFVSGCTPIFVAPTVKVNASPQAGNGYIAAQVSGQKNADLAFVIHNIATGVNYDMALGGSTVYRSITNQVSAIAVPPGRYAVTSWVTFATLTKDKLAGKPINNSVLSGPFSVGAGTVTFIGNFLISYSTYMVDGGYGLSWRIKSSPVSTIAAHEAFISAYPAFHDRPFNCRLCTDTAPGILQSEKEHQVTN